MQVYFLTFNSFDCRIKFSSTNLMTISMMSITGYTASELHGITNDFPA